jgi:acetate---CoA ligase (ADP-forming)
MTEGPLSLQPLLAPRGIAVVGASAKEGKLGYAMMTSLATFPGVVAGINPSGSDGMFPSLSAAVAQHPDLDLAVLCVSAAAVPDAVRQSAEAGVMAAVVCAGGFAEVGGAGDDLQQQLSAVIAETGIRVLGPNTSGFFRPGAQLFASFVPGVASLSEGAVGVVAASGGVNHALAFQLDRNGAGVSVGVGIGGGLDVSAVDVLEYLANDPTTRAVALHLETVPDGQRLLAAVRQVVAVKPLAAFVVGRNDIGDFAKSHTGALATSWATTRALLRQAGAVLVDSEIELVNAASALTARRMPPISNPGIGLVTGQAGPGLIMADELKTRGLELPAVSTATAETLSGLLPPMTYLSNPVDTGRPGPGFPKLLTAVADDPGVDLMGVYLITEPMLTLPDAVRTAKPRIATVAAIDGPAEELVRVRSLADQDAPVLIGPSALVHGLSALAADARAQFRRLSAEKSPRRAGSPAGPAGRRKLDGGWHEAAAKDLLDELGIPTPARRVCRDLDEALAALDDLPTPLVVKILDATVLHKSDIGGVHLGVRDEAGMRSAVEALQRIGATEYLVESMAPSGRDLLLGVRTDAVFGPIAVLGLGGVEAEVWNDTAICGVPAPDSDLLELPDQLTAKALLSGFRGAPALDRDELARILDGLADVVAHHPDITEIEINPLRLTANGLVALDAVVITGEPAKENIE